MRARGKVAKVNGADAGPHQALNRVPDRFQHAADLAVSALAQHDTKPREVSRAGKAGSRDDLDSGSDGDAVIESHATTETLEIRGARSVGESGEILALGLIPWMSDTVREGAVVGQNDQPFGVLV